MDFLDVALLHLVELGLPVVALGFQLLSQFRYLLLIYLLGGIGLLHKILNNLRQLLILPGQLLHPSPPLEPLNLAYGIMQLILQTFIFILKLFYPITHIITITKLLDRFGKLGVHGN